MKIWARNEDNSNYNFRKLIDRRQVKDKTLSTKQIICDIDKTYLETNFESVLKLVQIPFEDATDKITVSGANEVLKACRWGLCEKDPNAHPVALHFISSSPPQLRQVLTEKLMLDFLDWDSDTFKNQAYNIKKGRMDLLNNSIRAAMNAALCIGMRSGWLC